MEMFIRWFSAEVVMSIVGATMITDNAVVETMGPEVWRSFSVPDWLILKATIDQIFSK